MEKEQCKLCGRTADCVDVYFFKPQSRFDTGFLVPRLTEDEKYRLASGTNTICRNRTACRKPKSANAPHEPCGATTKKCEHANK